MDGTTRREILKRGAGATLLAGAAALPVETGAIVEPPTRTGGSRFLVGSCAYSYRQYLQATTNPITLYDFLDKCARSICTASNSPPTISPLL